MQIGQQIIQILRIHIRLAGHQSMSMQHRCRHAIIVRRSSAVQVWFLINPTQ